MYFVRLQFAHLYEGLKAVDDLCGDPELCKLVSQLDYTTRSTLDKLRAYLPGGAERIRLETVVGRLRDNVVFHYHERGKWIGAALVAKANESSLVSMGDEPALCHFQFADDIVEEMVLRNIWGVAPGPLQGGDADEMVGYIHEVFKMFMDFSIHYIWKYCE